jgi:TolB-like protein
MIDGSKPALPAGVPKKVAVASFSGEFPINVQSADQFSSGLVKLGFDVVERQHFDKVVKEIELQHSGMISDENITAAGKQLGVDGLFVGSVEGRSKGGFVNTFLNLRLVEIKTGKVVWAGSFSDPRIFALTEDVKTSIIYTTKEALEKLESDLRSVRG